MNPLGPGDPLRLGPYRLLGVLGEGGMGKVYLGQDGGGTVAAVKVLLPELAHDQHLVQRFLREAHAARAVVSKGVARVLGADLEGARPWIATEFLAGPTLDQAVGAQGPFEESAVRALAASLARTLADVHAAGLIHRDLKPSNIVLTSAGPRVIDFGIARPQHGLTLTTTGQIPVTPGYGAPEQVLGRRVTAPADVFSLGAVLVHAASGRRAFDAGHVAALQYEVVHGEPALDGVPEALRPLVASCLAKDPALRPVPAGIVQSAAAPRGAGRVWRRGWVGSAIKERESSVHQLTTATAGGAGAVGGAGATGAGGGGGGVGRRGLVAGLAAGGVVLAGGGGTAVWWLASERGSSGGADGKSDPFAFPPAAKKPTAHVLSADDGDYIVGKSPKALWGPRDVLHIDTPAPLPVRDVIVFATKDGGIAAHNVVNGKRRWSAPKVRGLGRYVSLSDRLIAAVDEKGTVRTYVASTGEPKWTARAGAEFVLAADARAVYVLTEDGRLRSIGRSDARIRWTVRVPAPFRKKIAPQAAVGNGRLVLPTTDGHVLAVRTGDGGKAWTLMNRWEKDAAVRPCAHGDAVYVNGKSLTARRMADGKELWTVTNEDPLEEGTNETWGPPSVHGDSVYAVHEMFFRRMKRSDGSEVWDSRPSGAPDSPAVVQGGGVWAVHADVSNTVVTANNEDGSAAWDYELSEQESRWLVADGNRVFVVNGTELIALPVF